MPDVEMHPPQTETRPSPSATNLTLFCCLVGSNAPFPVHISTSLTVSHLKKMIKQEKQNDLKEIDADKLELFQVAVPDEDDLEERVKDTVKGMKPLKSTKKLSKIFPDEPPEETIHIAVKLPNDVALRQHRRVNSAPDQRKIDELRLSMNNEFIGDAGNALHEYLVTCRNNFAKDYYAKLVSVCNSSGTGKTKTILQLRNYDIPVLYINMRGLDDNKNFPLRDSKIADLFESAMSNAVDYSHSCTVIFRALFQQLLIEFEQRLSSTPDFDFTKMVRTWNEDFTPVALDTQKRDNFFNAVKKLYDEKKDMPGSAKSMCEHYRKLCNFVENRRSKDVPIVFAIDETQSLTEWRGSKEDGFYPSHILGQVIKEYSTSYLAFEGNALADVWVLFSSTNSKVNHFAAPAPIHPSHRVLSEGLNLFPPFSALHWDLFAPPLEELNVLSVGSYEDAIRFGRPLWQSLASLYSEPVLMSHYAVEKLTGRKITDTIPNDHEVNLAVLSQRFALGVLFGSREAVPFISKSVASYMRILLSTTEDRLWQRTSYPSEPILSHAAAQVMYEREESLGALLATLASKMLSGLIEAGEFGELLGRLLILISRDFATILAYDIKISGSPPKDILPSTRHSVPFPPLRKYFPYLRPVPLLDVLSILFGHECLFGWEKPSPQAEKRAQPADTKLAQRIKSKFARAYVSFSHWVVLTENIGSKDEKDDTPENVLKALFIRGAAIQCCHNQPLIDAVIPIMYLDQHGQYVGMSSWLIQYKNRKAPVSGALYSIVVNNEHINLDTKRSYVATCFQFGAKEAPTCAVFPEEATTRSSSQATEALRIGVRGFSREKFPVLFRGSVWDALTAIKDANKKLTETLKNESVSQKSLHVLTSRGQLARWGVGVKRKFAEVSE